MSATHKVFEVNTLNGANIVTCATTRTLAVIDGGKVVFNLDCSLRTGLLTLHTSDTANRANLACYSTLIMAGALNKNSGLFADDVDNAIGTSLCTKATTDTLLRINLGDALL